jgi:(p)ppGpp synthase/HD superfamily hydrolase
MNQLARAISLAAQEFDGRVDQGKQPYILHCLRVMNNLHTRDQELQAIAVLHDYAEDNSFFDIEESLAFLRDQGFSERIIRAVDLLSHRENVSYDEYIKALAHNEDARLVKLADLKDNSNITRLKGLRKKDLDRMEKYHRAYIYLSV